MKIEKELKAKLKLDNRAKVMIALYICTSILDIITVFTSKNLVWGLCALQCLSMAVIEYCVSKIIKTNNALIELKDEQIRLQEEIIRDLTKKYKKEME